MVPQGQPGSQRDRSGAGNEAKKAGEGIIKDALSTQAAATTGSEIQ